MKAKTVMVEREKPRTKEELAQMEKVIKKIQEARKDPDFKRFIRAFIRYHTS